ncbi:MAG: alpha/beta hydrolase [Deltaproteobacteria bacterium]|nr:alpha/beta hydrolase [Deltaproteobacteria bacterium]
MKTPRCFILLIGLFLASAHCDLGGRSKGPVDSGLDGGDTDTGEGGVDAGGDADWNDVDAGSWWQDGGVVVAPCDNDCNYLYRMDSGHYESSSKSYFKISAGDTGFVRARDVSTASYSDSFMNPSPTTCDDYYRISNRRKMTATYTLAQDTHALVTGEALVYESFEYLSIELTQTSYTQCGAGGVGITRRYTFAYDAAAQSFSYTVERDGRSWGRSMDSAQAPLVMFNLREYPLESYGNQSPLFAFLLGERYAWDVGGVQQIPIFSPEAERLELIAVEAVSGADQLVIHYPVDTARAPVETNDNPPATVSANAVPITYDQGIPTTMGTRNGPTWGLTSGIPFELNMAGVGATTPASAPTPQGGYTTSQINVASGDVSLSGVVDRPSGPGTHPVVVMLPGWDRMTRLGEVGAVDLYAQLADLLAHEGFVVVRTDSRGNGASTGDLSTATVDDLARDAVAVVGALTDLPVAGADPSRVFLLTTGLGVHVATKAASLLGDDVAGILLVAPIAREYGAHAAVLAERYATNAGLAAGGVTHAGDQISAVMSSLADGTYAGDAYEGHTSESWQSLLGRDLVDDCTESKAACTGLPPVLVVAGKEDHAVSPADATELEAALEVAGVDAALLAPKGLSHAITPGTAMGLWPEHSSIEAVDEDAAGAIAGWLDEKSGGAL